LPRGRPTLVEDAATLSPQLTQQEIAVMIGSVGELVQREVKALERAGAIAQSRGRVRILDLEILEQWSGRGASPND
jgi:Crp-like helix-turn-helix domain